MSEEQLTPDNQRAEQERLNHIFDTSSEKNRNALLSFLAVQLYLFATIGSTTDLQLLLSNTAFNLPLVNIGIPIVGFYIFAPILFLILHFNLLLNLSEHVDILHDWQGEQPAKSPSRHRFPYLINIIAYYQAQQNGDSNERKRNGFKLFITKGVAVLAIGGFPVALLLFFQLRFSDYQSVWISALHSAIVLADLLVLYLYARNFKLPVLTALNKWAYRGFMLGVVGLTGVMLLVVTLVVLVPSVFIEEGDGESWSVRAAWIIPNLDVSEEQVSPIKDELKNTYSLEVRNNTSKFWTLYQRLTFKNRNFNFANFDGAILYNVEFRDVAMYGVRATGASFQGAKFEGVTALYGYFGESNFNYTTMNGVDFSFAGMRGAYFIRSNIIRSAFYQNYLSFAQFMGAELHSSDFAQSYLNGADFRGADIVHSDIQISSARKASFDGASFHFANLSRFGEASTSYSGVHLRDVKWTVSEELEANQINHCVVSNVSIANNERGEFNVHANSVVFPTCVGFSYQLEQRKSGQVVYQEIQPIVQIKDSQPIALLNQTLIDKTQPQRLDDFHIQRRKMACENPWVAFGLVRQNKLAQDKGYWWHDKALMSHIENDDVCKHNKVKAFLLEHYDKADELF